MSNYRDDETDGAVIRDKTWGGFRRPIVEEYAHIAAAVLVTIGATVTETAQAQDAVFERAVMMTVEQAAVADAASGTAHAVAPVIVETARAQDAVMGSTAAFITETARIADEPLFLSRAFVTDGAQAADWTGGILHARAMLTESAQIRGETVTHVAVSGFAEDAAHAHDWTGGTLHSRDLCEDVARLSDDAPSVTTAASFAIDAARATDAVIDHLHATDTVSDYAVASDALVGQEIVGQAWVSEAGNWAMSRYAPFGFLGAANVGGTVFLAGQDGLYALDGDSEEIEAHLVTGKVDISGGNLARPVSLYLEYELTGALAVTVGQTQRGVREQWTYSLPPELAEELTNGRVQFGRGLRGRHFRFDVAMRATSGYINDATLLVEKTSRRI